MPGSRGGVAQSDRLLQEAGEERRRGADTELVGDKAASRRVCGLRHGKAESEEARQEGEGKALLTCCKS